MEYRPIWTATPPRIDGLLADDIWTIAPVDARFYARESKPYGQPTTEPTSVQVAYDAHNLYVAIHCGYAAPGPRDDDVPATESDLSSYSEAVSILVDGQHDHANSRVFSVTRTGARADVDLTNNGTTRNEEWTGIWSVAVQTGGDGWTAEFALPLTTLNVTSSTIGTLGINFRRNVPRAHGFLVWSLPPPDATYGPAFFGHLAGLLPIRPDKRLFLAPYLALAGGAAAESPLRRFVGNRDAAGYGGLYARLRPTSWAQVDVTANPDFSQVAPDQLRVNLGRYELVFPEVRPFFAEDRPRFEFGTPSALLFFSRRIGLTPGAAGFDEVPILYGTKLLLRRSGFELGAMDLGLLAPDSLTFDDHVTVVRPNYLFGGSSRLGAIAMARNGSYQALGVDGVIGLAGDHLIASGFGALSHDPTHTGFAGNAAISWASQEFEASLSYLYAGEAFDPQLGYFEQVGANRVSLQSAYIPQIYSDQVRDVVFSAGMDRNRDLDENLLTDRVSVGAVATLLQSAQITVGLTSSDDRIASPFTLAGSRTTIAAGQYHTRTLSFSARTPPGNRAWLGLGYAEGDFWGGYERNPSVQLGLKYARVNTLLSYGLYVLDRPDLRLVGHQLSARALYAYTPRARSVLSVEANTVDRQVVSALINTLTFGDLSTLAVVLSQKATDLDGWVHAPERRAILSFTLGVSFL